jgi:hypothetical protein
VQERLLKAQGSLAKKQSKAASYDYQKTIAQQWSYRLGETHWARFQLAYALLVPRLRIETH